MRRDGSETLALWREAGEWWAGQPPREVHRFIDRHGVRRETFKVRPAFSGCQCSKQTEEEDHTEEWSLRIHKVRDEKLAYARGLPTKPQFPVVVLRRPQEPYAALHVSSGYSFGRGTMLAAEIPVFAATSGIAAVALTDAYSLVGAVEFVRACKNLGVRPLVGATIGLPEGGEIVLIAASKQGYASLSRLISACHLDEPRQFPLGSWERLERYSRGVICLTGGDNGPLNRALIRRDFEAARSTLHKLTTIYGQTGVFVEIERSFLPWERAVNSWLLELAELAGVVPVASVPTTHARRDHFPAQDTLVCASSLCLIEEIIGRKPPRHETQPPLKPRPERALNAERFLRTPEEMRSLFSDRPDLLANTMKVVERCDEDVLPARTRLPEIFPDPNHALREIVEAGAHLRYPKITPRIRKRLSFELDRIAGMEFSNHFLTIWDACRWADDQGILFSGRGSVVDSAVAFCLGLNRVDAYRHNLHFDRFLPGDGSKRPDIDIDFEAHRREDVRQYLTRKYGADHVATVAAIGTFCTRGIIREVGKVFGLPNDLIGFLSKRVHGGISPDRLEAALESRPELRNSGIPKERFKWVLELAERLQDIPRNIRSHSSGVVISREPIWETVPVMQSAAEVGDSFLRIIQWDKRSAKHYFDKFDILCLRGHDVLAGTQQRVRLNDIDFRVESLSMEDEETYRAMRSGELIGIPQSASPAMRQAHIRLKTANLHDASLVQAGIRPGVGGAVKLNELIARRRGKPYSFEHPELEKILGLTYGIIVFQEQVDQLLQTFAGYTSGQAEEIREAIHEKRREDFGESIRDEVVRRVLEKGYTVAVANQVCDYVAGFKGYGFAQGHALAFAEISLRSISCQQNYPAEYFASLLSAQPAGYYGPCTIVNEARTRGVSILPPDVNLSKQEFSVENVRSSVEPFLTIPNGAIRVALDQVSGISKQLRLRILELRPFTDYFDFVWRAQPQRDELERLILCGALDRFHPNRRAMLWAIPLAERFASKRSEGESVLPLGFVAPDIPEGITDFGDFEKAVYERSILDLDVECHLMGFERERVASKGGITSREARSLPGGRKAIVVGNPIRLRFPPTPSGKRVVFFDLEDEEGLLNVTCFDDVYRRDGHSIVCSAYVTLIGETQDRDGHIAFLAHRVFPYTPAPSKKNEPVRLPMKTADFLVG